MNKLCLILALVFSGSATAAFKCVDEKGRTHVGDTPPPGCANVVMYEVTRGGTVLRTIQPTMTDEQYKAKLEAEEKQRAADKATAEQKRKDVALLSTYSSEKEFDVALDRNIDPIRARITQSKERVKEIAKRSGTIKEEMEFYKAGKRKGAKVDDMPSGLAAELKRLEDEKKSIDRTLGNYDREIGELKNKYDTDKQRWIALKSGAKTVEAPAPKPVAGTLGAGAAGTARCGDKIYECPAGQTYSCRIGTTVTRVNCVVER